MKKSYAFAALFVALVMTAAASPWAVTVNFVNASISTIDLGASPPKIYGPFFQGQLGNPNDGVLDVAVTPNGRYALVTSFYGRTVFKIDLADPTHPVLAGVIQDTFIWPEDVAISPDGQFAVISDGSSDISDHLLFIDIASFGGYSLYQIQTGDSAVAQAVAVTPDRTVIAADFMGDRMIYGKANAAGTGLVSERMIDSGWAVINLAVSPDGSTVLAACAGDPSIRVYAFDAGGALVETGKIDTPLMSPHTVVFSRDGRMAYAFAGGWGYSDKVIRMAVAGPGQVVYQDRIDLLSDAGSGYFGVDVMDVTPDGRYAVVGFGTNWVNWGSPDKGVQLVNLADGTVSWIPTGMSVPAGVACFEAAVYAPADASVTRLTSNFIFYKEGINRLTWQANPENFTPIAGYRISRKLKSAPDSAYQPLINLPSNVFKYDDRGLDKNAAYSYRLTAVNAEGRESAPVTVSN